MKYTYNFEKLLIWQKSKELAVQVCKMTKTFPKEERFALSDQLRRAAISVPSNLAEGTSRSSRRDQARFVEIAYGSLCEVICQLEIAVDLGYLTKDTKARLRAEIVILSRMISAYKLSLQKSKKK